jgi:CRP-like cAMP-binding protein
LLQKIPLFHGLSAKELEAIAASSVRRDVDAGGDVVREGDPAAELFVLLDGHAEVLRRDAGRDAQHAIGAVSPGQVIGELALFDRAPRAATVRATEASTLLVVPFHALGAHPQFLMNLARGMSERLRDQGEASFEAAQQRAAMGELIVKVLVMLCGYAILLSALPQVREHLPGSTTWISLPVIGLFGIASWRFLRNSGKPLASFGLGFRHAFGSLVEAALITPPFLAVLDGVQWVLLRAVPALHGQKLIENLDVAATLADPTTRRLLVIYAISSAVQEMIVRCALQASLEDFLVGERRVATAIFTAGVMFSVNHLHMSFLFAALAFLPGLLWGWMFHRRRNLLGVTLSHVVVGGFVFFVLGVKLG